MTNKYRLTSDHLAPAKLHSPHRRVTLLASLDDLHAVKAVLPAALDGLVLAHDPDVHLALLEAGISHITPWDIVSADEYAAVRDFQARVYAAWDAFARIPYAGLDLLRIARYRHVSALSRMAWAAYVVRRCFERLAPSEICVFEETAGHGLDQPPDHRRMPVFHAIAQGMAESAGIPVTLLHRPPESAAFQDWCADPDSNSTPPNPKSALVDAPTNSPALENWPPARDYILFHANGTDLLRQDALIQSVVDAEALAATGPDSTQPDVIQLYRTADAALLGDLRARGRTLWHEPRFFDLYDRGPADFDPQPDYVRFKADRSLLEPDLRSVLANPRADFHFDFLFGDYAHKLRRHVDVWTALFRRARPALLVASYHAPIVDVAVACGVPTLVLTHGLMLMGDNSWYTSLPRCHIGAISPLQRDKLIHAGISPSRLHLTGDPGIADLLAARSVRPPCRTLEQDHRSPAPSAAGLRQRLGVTDHGRLILLVTSNLGSPSKLTRLPVTDFAAAAADHQAVSGIIERHPEWTFAVRPHPRYDHLALHDRLDRALPPDRRPKRFAAAESVAAIIDAADAVVVMNVVTSAIMELSLRPKPVFIVASAMPWYDADQWGTDAWPHILSSGALEATLAEIFADPRALAAAVAQTQSGLRAFFAGDPADPLHETRTVISRLARPAPAASISIPARR